MPNTWGRRHSRIRASILAAGAAIGLLTSIAECSPHLRGGDEGFIYPDKVDLNADKLADSLLLLPLGDPDGGNDCNVGEVRIVSGATGQVITRFLASTCGDGFGSSIAIVKDMNGDGNDDLIIGAPLHGTGGRAYVFLGPFGTGSGTQLIFADQANIEFAPPDGIDHFGERVGAVTDLDGDGRPDIRIRAKEGSAIRTFIVSGADGFPLFLVRGTSPFNPWLRPQSDVDDDGDVDTNDLAIVNAHLGQSGSSVGIFQGDVNGTHSVNSVDVSIVTGHQGTNQFSPILIGGDPKDGGTGGIWTCPPTLPPSFWCVPNCWGLYNYIPINVDPLCLPITCQAWCGFDIVDHGAALMPFATYAQPYVFEAINGLGLESLEWTVLEGAERIQCLECSVGRTFEFYPKHNGVVRVRAKNSICSYICEVEVETNLQLVDSDADGMPDAWELWYPTVLSPNNPLDAESDPDLDGIKNLYEFAYWTDPTTSDAPDDSDHDGIPDLCEIALGSDPEDGKSPEDAQVDSDFDSLGDYYEQCVFLTDPNDSDSDDDGMPDGWEMAHGLSPLFAPDAWIDSDEDGVANLFEYMVGSNPKNSGSVPPLSLDADQDGFLDWIEVLYGSDPQSDQSQPDPSGMVFLANDVDFALINSAVVGVYDSIIEMCVGDCFELHGSGFVTSWEVLQGLDKLTEISPDTSLSCYSGLWCTKLPGTIVIGAATGGGHGVFEGPPAWFSIITIIVKPEGECDGCEVDVDVCGSDEPPAVCVGDVVCLAASGVEGPGPYQWTVLEFAEFVGPSSGPTVMVLVTGVGDIFVGCKKGDCVGGITLHTLSVDLDIDSDNNNGVTSPDRSATEDDLEDTPRVSGKLIFTGLSDADDDGIPDWADGLDIRDLSYGTSGAAFVPLVLDISAATFDAVDEGAYVTLDYDLSDPAVVRPNNSTRPPGAFRIWTKDGSELRNPVSVVLGGDLIYPGDNIDRPTFDSLRSSNGTVKLFVEAINPALSEEQRSISASFYFEAGSRGCESPVVDLVKAAAIEIETMDAREWGPVYTSPGVPRSLSNPNLNDPLDESPRIGGAITDGASLCVFRLRPMLPEITQLWPDLEIAMVRADDPTVNIAKVVGTFTEVTAGGGTPVLPSLPTPWETVQGEGPSVVNFASGKALYVPPETYADPTEVLVAQALNSAEECPMRIELRQGGTAVASRAFLLRRPPLVLVHGIMSNPATWDTTQWNESPGAPLSTRVYKANWGLQGTLGYGESYNIVALTIELALEEYRTANDNGHASTCGFHGIRYAATRADVVAHSQGGQLTRFYIADDMPELIDRVGWATDLDNHRDEGDAEGHWPYLRSANFGTDAL